MKMTLNKKFKRMIHVISLNYFPPLLMRRREADSRLVDVGWMVNGRRSSPHYERTLICDRRWKSTRCYDRLDVFSRRLRIYCVRPLVAWLKWRGLTASIRTKTWLTWLIGPSERGIWSVTVRHGSMSAYGVSW